MLARVTGLVLGTERVNGRTKDDRPYDFMVASVLVAGRDVSRVQLSTVNDLGAGGRPLGPSRGEVVDWLVQVSVYRGEPSMRLESPEFDEAAGLDLPTAVAV